MSILKLTHPRIVGTNTEQLDPDIINANFKDISRVINGGLGAENLKKGSVVPWSTLGAGRNWIAVSLGTHIACSNPPQNTEKFLFSTQSEMRLLGAQVYINTLVNACYVGGATSPVVPYWFQTISLLDADIRTYGNAANASLAILNISAPVGITSYFVSASNPSKAGPVSSLLPSGTNISVRTRTGSIERITLYFTADHTAY